MAEETTPPLPAGADDSKATLALGLAIATVVSFVILAAIDHDGAGWVLQPVLGLATLVTAWMAAKGMPRSGKALIAFVIGALAVLNFIGWIILDGS